MNSTIKKNYLFLGFAIPQIEMTDTFERDKFPSIQTHKFNWNLIKGLEHHDKYNFTYISARPVTDYPFFPKLKLKKNKWSVSLDDKKIEILEIPYINSGIFKIFTRFFSALFYSLTNYHSKNNKAGVIVYSVHIPYMIVGLLISKLYNIDYIAIWTDPPAVRTNVESSVKSKLRNIELYLSKLLMKKSTKIVSVTKFLAEDFAPGKPYLVMEGIINQNEINYSSQLDENRNDDLIRIVYTGSVNEKYGIKNIIDGFLSMQNKNAILEIYGRGDFENELEKITNTNKNVIYKGFVPNSEIILIQRKADFLINARSNNEEFVKYSFPSKTLEYMLSGTPLVTTMLIGIPQEYKEYLIILEDNMPITIGEKLDQIVQYTNQERSLIGKKAREFAETKNYIDQAKKIIDLLDTH
ncbi:glycosyltransferase [Proteiniclasticum sp.]|uniref:glycosyltransferase n=1 Tax=Proteiniclasticum sp. TaxID=2053595 RepID=UPI002897E648|nr:glycosyltransferase [Proteiniclasticum sp.]